MTAISASMDATAHEAWVRLPLDEIIQVAVVMQVELINGNKPHEMHMRMPVRTPPLRAVRRRDDTRASNPLAFPARESRLQARTQHCVHK